MAGNEDLPVLLAVIFAILLTTPEIPALNVALRGAIKIVNPGQPAVTLAAIARKVPPI